MVKLYLITSFENVCLWLFKKQRFSQVVKIHLVHRLQVFDFVALELSTFHFLHLERNVFIQYRKVMFGCISTVYNTTSVAVLHAAVPVI